jgi:hypothetical protein
VMILSLILERLGISIWITLQELPIDFGFPIPWLTDNKISLNHAFGCCIEIE